jgi:hypothetical protein
MGELTQRENDWQDRATAAAIAAARQIVLGDAAVIPMNTPIGRLSDVEWGWIATAVIFGWIATRARQATTEDRDVEQSIRDGVDGAWDAGAVATILPKLADLPDIDWSKPLAEWPRETMIVFLTKALGLAHEAISARDLSGGSITRKTSDNIIAV